MDRTAAPDPSRPLAKPRTDQALPPPERVVAPWRIRDASEEGFAGLFALALDLHLGGPSTEYKDAHLGDHTLAGHTLYEEIATTYRDFDKTAHFDASRIQRCFMRYRERRHRKALYLQRVFRGFRTRKKAFLTSRTPS